MTLRTIGIIVVAACALTTRAQELGNGLGSDKTLEKMFGASSQENQLQQLQLPKFAETQYSDSRVDPKHYHVGPYDALLLAIWQPINQMALLTVSPEGDLVVPRVGTFSTVGKTLDSVRAEVIHALQTRMKDAEASLTLYKPRNVLVQVAGDVQQPGSYVVPATSRAAMAIQLANLPPKESAMESAEQAQRKVEKTERDQSRRQYFGGVGAAQFSLRHIVLRHNDGTTDHVDIQKYDATQDENVNPMLREGDQIFVSPVRLDLGQIAIYGAVHQPGTYEFVQGDSLTTLVAMAYGPTESAELGHVTLQHFDASGNMTGSDVVDLGAVLAKRVADVALHAGDGVVVSEQVVRSEFGAVAVKGEVLHPSVFGIVRGTTKLSEIIRRAGMFTPNANVAAGFVVRRIMGSDGKEVDPREFTQQAYMNSPLTLEDTLNFNMQSRLRRGTVVVDFRRLFIDGDSSADIALEDGDEITVPRNTNQVFVYGQVHFPGFVTFVPGKPAAYYIAQAGGAEESAEPGGAGVIKNTRRTWDPASRAVIDPGDAVYVPKVPDLSASVREQSTGNLFLAASVIAAIGGVIVNYVLFHK